MEQLLRDHPDAHKTIEELVHHEPPQPRHIDQSSDLATVNLYIVHELGMCAQRFHDWFDVTEPFSLRVLNESRLMLNHARGRERSATQLRILREDIIEGNHPLIELFQRPSALLEAQRKVLETAERLLRAPALLDMPMDSAVIVWKAHQNAAFLTLSGWQRVVIINEAFQVAKVLDRHNIPTHVVHSVYHPVARQGVTGDAALRRWA